MIRVLLTAKADADLDDMPAFIKPKIIEAFTRLADWPQVSGAKPLRGDRHGSFRLRVRDYRIIFRCEPDRIHVERILVTDIGNRRDIYED